MITNIIVTFVWSICWPKSSCSVRSLFRHSLNQKMGTMLHDDSSRPFNSYPSHWMNVRLRLTLFWYKPPSFSYGNYVWKIVVSIRTDGLYQNKVKSSLVSPCNCKRDYRAFSVTCSAAMQIAWNKIKFKHVKRVQFTLGKKVLKIGHKMCPKFV